MFKIDTFTRGRFGNRILQYNNMMQLANIHKTEASTTNWEGSDLFINLVTSVVNEKEDIILRRSDILKENYGVVDLDKNYVISSDTFETPLHNTFFHVTKTDPAQFFEIREEYQRELPTDVVNVGIHLRGGDNLKRSEGREIHSSTYYREAIKMVLDEFGENVKFYIGTDDRNFNNYLDTVSYLKNKNLNYDLGNDNPFIDFYTLSECDVIVCCSSTFTICASFIGKKNKKIIHSMEWIQKSLDHTLWHPSREKEEDHVREWQLSFDQFWIDLYNGGNEFYKIWRCV